jgi:CcmD family protein
MVYLASALIIVWLLITLYVLYIAVRQRQLEQEMRILEETLQEQANRQ